jgi:ABC-type branched-subunit amino acid transport system ATPase component
VVAVVGEPGVGKSRLFWELIHSHRGHGRLVVKSASSPRQGHTIFRDRAVRGYFAIESRARPAKIREKVTGKVLTLGPALGPVARPLGSSRRAGGRGVVARGRSFQRRPQTLDAIKRPLRESVSSLWWWSSKTCIDR